MKYEKGYIDTFILAHWEHLTMSDMALELNITTGSIKFCCDKLNIIPIKRKQQVINFIKEHSNWPLSKLAKAIGIAPEQIIKYSNELGIELETHNYKICRTPNFTNEELKRAKDFFTSSNIQRHPPIYNQSGSDFLDKKNGIQTTKRVTMKAIDAQIK